MSDYNEFVTSINKIFDYLTKMKAGWNSLDNSNYIESIEEYKRLVAQDADLFKEPPKETVESLDSLEALGND